MPGMAALISTFNRGRSSSEGLIETWQRAKF